MGRLFFVRPELVFSRESQNKFSSEGCREIRRPFFREWLWEIVYTRATQVANT
jgi:hypothetical protein